MLGSQAVVGALVRHGVRTIFSLSGNQIMPLYDACLDARIRIVHVRHEAAAVYMADAWAQVTGEIGVALLTAGPGLANGVAPLYAALQAESPVLLLSGDSAIAEDGLGAFQEMDQATLTRPVTKLSRRVMRSDALVASIDGAVATAKAPRSGPVHLALPFDLLTAACPSSSVAPAQAGAQSDGDASRAGSPAPRIESIAQLLAAAQRPIVLAGPSACRAFERATWQAVRDRLQVPVIGMESPRGLRDPAAGTAAVQIAKADLVVLAGKPLDFTLGFGRGAVFAADAKFAVIDPDAAMLARTQRLLGDRVAFACQADARPLLERAASAASAPAPRAAWVDAVASALAAREPATPVRVAPGAIGSRQLAEHVQRFIDGCEEPILVCDGGEFGQWAQAFCRAPVRIINGTAGAIGGGICHAIAAKIARPQATVVLLMGDGTSGFHFTEFDTAVRENAPFVAVIGNDLRWNAEHLIQQRDYGPDRTIGCSLAESARYHDAAAALGGFGAHVTEAGDVDAALRAAAASGLPACVNVRIDSQPAPVYTTAAHKTH
jgi:acetolactate synthase-1/2/3 large subunit